MENTKNTISPMAFTALAISSIFATSNLAVLAANGGQLIFLLFITVIFFFIPVSAVVGELATGEGWGTNVFSWIKTAFGERVGLAAVFWEWFQSVVMSLPMLYFLVGTFAYAVNFPEMNNNSLYKLLMSIFFYLFLVGIQLFKPKLLLDVEAFGFWICVVIPVVITFILSAVYIFQGNPLPFPLKSGSFIPALDVKSFLALIPFVLSLTGIETSGPFVNRLTDIKKDFPKAIAIVIVTGIFANLIGSGAIALVFSSNQINLSSGFIDTTDFLFRHFGLPSVLVRIIAFFIVFGILPKISNWIISPALALQSSAAYGMLPEKFAYKNSDGTPVYILIFQSYLMMMIGFFLSMTKSGNTAFLIAIYLDVAIYSCVYVLIFLAYLKLIVTQQETKRIFEIPKALKKITGIFGLISISAILLLSFLPPAGIPQNEVNSYLLILMFCFILIMLAPFLFQYIFIELEKKKN